jgi:hypothetical protein
VYEGVVPALVARPSPAGRESRRETSPARHPACRAVAITLAVAVLAAVADAHQKRTSDPRDTEYQRAERNAERARNFGRNTFAPLTWWVRMDLRKLQDRTARLAKSVDQPAPDLRAARSHARKVSKHSHTAARWLQGHRQSRPHSEPQAGPPRDLKSTLDDVETIEHLVREIAALYSHPSQQLDVSRHIATLEALERVEALATQVEADLKGR